MIFIPNSGNDISKASLASLEVGSAPVRVRADGFTFHKNHMEIIPVMELLETIAEQPLSFSELIERYDWPKTSCGDVFP